MNSRPITLKEIAERSDSIEEFGRHLRDWLHELRNVSSRSKVTEVIAEPAPLLRKKFIQGAIADAWLAAYAEQLASKAGVIPPDWAFEKTRIISEPAFADGGENPKLRALALVRSPLPFKRRNLYTTSVDLPFAIRSGRPKKSLAEKRKKNAERQKRFRQRLAAELKKLRRQARSS